MTWPKEKSFFFFTASHEIVHVDKKKARSREAGILRTFFILMEHDTRERKRDGREAKKNRVWFDVFRHLTRPVVRALGVASRGDHNKHECPSQRLVDGCAVSIAATSVHFFEGTTVIIIFVNIIVFGTRRGSKPTKPNSTPLAAPQRGVSHLFFLLFRRRRGRRRRRCRRDEKKRRRRRPPHAPRGHRRHRSRQPRQLSPAGRVAVPLRRVRVGDGAAGRRTRR